MSYRLPIRYFIVMSLMLLMSGMWLSFLHTGWSFDGVMEYYAAKSLFGLLETVTAHLLAMGIIVFLFTHFFAVIKGIEQQNFYRISLAFFVVMLLSNLSGFFVSDIYIFFGLVKYIATLLFLCFSLFVSYKLFKVS